MTWSRKQFSQEFQLLGDHGRLNWIAGAYYFNEEGQERKHSRLYGFQFSLRR